MSTTLRGPMPDYPDNPGYGRGVFRRRIRLEGRPGEVYGALEDTNHGFCVRVCHDGIRVTAIHPEARRTPFDTCPEALANVQALVGQPIDAAARTLTLTAVPAANCTHLLDLTVLAIRHAVNGYRTRQWDVTVTDESEHSDSVASVLRDGQLVYQWKARHFLITEPQELEGRPLYLGFGRWASQHFAADALEAAFILQKGYFVAQARRFDLNAMAGEPALASQDSMAGACYTYSPGAIEHGVRTRNAVRDFSGDDTQLLLFK